MNELLLKLALLSGIILWVTGCSTSPNDNIQYKYNIEIENNNDAITIDSIDVVVTADGDTVLNETYPASDMLDGMLTVTFLANRNAEIEVQYDILSNGIIVASGTHIFDESSNQEELNPTINTVVSPEIIAEIIALTNNQPHFTTTLSEIDTLALTGSIYTVSFLADDEDGDSLSLNLVSGPVNITFNGLELIWEPGILDTGVTTISVEIIDSNGGSEIITWTVTITDTVPYFGFSPFTGDASVDDVIKVELGIRNVEGLFGFAADIIFDAEMLEPLESNFAPGDFLGSELVLLNYIENDTLSSAASKKFGDTPVDGSGILSTYEFRILKTGTVTISINSDYDLIGEDGADIAGTDGFESGDLVITVE